MSEEKIAIVGPSGAGKSSLTKLLTGAITQKACISTKREFCCSVCGLIWFAEADILMARECPECGENHYIYACDTFGYSYASKEIKASLKARGRDIHYAKDHPYHGK